MFRRFLKIVHAGKHLQSLVRYSHEIGDILYVHRGTPVAAKPCTPKRSWSTQRQFCLKSRSCPAPPYGRPSSSRPNPATHFHSLRRDLYSANFHKYFIERKRRLLLSFLVIIIFVCKFASQGAKNANCRIFTKNV